MNADRLIQSDLIAHNCVWTLVGSVYASNILGRYICGRCVPFTWLIEEWYS